MGTRHQTHGRASRLNSTIDEHNPMKTRAFLRHLSTGIAMLTGVLATMPMAALAQVKPIRLIVPYAPGGPIDVTARVLAERVKDSLGTVIIENRPGGGGNIGVDAVAKAAPDGLTIGIAALATHAINPWLYSKMPFNVATDFAPITQMVRVPNVLVINADTANRLGIRSLADLIRYAKANPGRLNYGSGGNGSGGHLAGEMFKAQAGIFAVHIPYNGGSPAQLALLSGQVDFNFDNLATAAANIKAGKLRALAVTTAQRSPALPDVEPVSDTFKGFAVDTWWGLVAPAGTPREVIARLNQAFAAALNSPEARTRFGALMAEPVPSSPEQFGTFMAGELAKYEKAVKASGARVD
jgi:tripartite-type tricarboxylate transporter receptor subunit TctC